MSAMSAPVPSIDTVRELQKLPAAFLDRYNQQGPRYTSYPTAPEWNARVGEGDYLFRVRQDALASPEAPISLYLHIPFCEVRCLFCACNAILARRKEVADPYLQDMNAEMGIVAEQMRQTAARQRPVIQVHFGGGNPNFLTPDQMRRIFGCIRARFTLHEKAEISLEANPCSTSDAFLDALAALGFNRISFGVQDFHLKTQEAIGRVQSVDTTRRVTERARKLGFTGINYDLIYGLPYQTVESFDQTLSKVIGLGPDRVALYNFAYLPERLGHQRAIDPASLPKGSERFRILIRACERFFEAGYEYIGMDHFARPDDALAQARHDRTLKRNFMGYTTQAGTDLYAFGVSAISMTNEVYVQNTKSLDAYASTVRDGHLPIDRGIVLTTDDRIRRDVIHELMCHGSITKPEVEERYGIQFDSYFSNELGQLSSFEADGLLKRTGDGIELTLLGTVFARNVAMLFDAYLRRPESARSFSRTL
jgi:oxygen-independent coproporphyrinogen-3 oxidase